MNKYYPQINVWRLTPPELPRQLVLTFDPANTIGVIASCLVGPWAGLIIAIFSSNPQFLQEIGIITNVIQFMIIGYAYRKIQPPWKILAIPLGTVAIIIIHPTIIGYIIFGEVFVYLFWIQNIIFQAIVNSGIYLLFQFIAPQLFKWVNPEIS